MARIYYSLYSRMLSPQNLWEAFKKVKSAQGAPGVDGQTVSDFAAKISENVRQLAKELREKQYRPLPVKRVEIPKPDGGIRKLGIPTVCS